MMLGSQRLFACIFHIIAFQCANLCEVGYYICYYWRFCRLGGVGLCFIYCCCIGFGFTEEDSKYCANMKDILVIGGLCRLWFLLGIGVYCLLWIS